MFKVCAFMSVFNEEDIISEVLSKLISNGIDVVILNNGSTDSTVEQIKPYVGNGVVEIFDFVSFENDKKVFKLKDILLEFEARSKKMDYDWYLISDADEIKYSPWSNLSLSNAIQKVDALGFNLIEFKLFDFRPTNDDFSIDYETSLNFFEAGNNASSIQMKCWKKSDVVDISSYGGHIISIPAPRLFPLKFINKHYPIRSAEHAFRKLRVDRLPRYSRDELAKGWHTQYNDILINDLEDLSWDKSKLAQFDISVERVKIFEEALEGLFYLGLLNSSASFSDIKQKFSNYVTANNICTVAHADQIFNVVENIYKMSSNLKLPPILVDKNDLPLIKGVLQSLLMRDYISGDLLKARNLKTVELISA